MPEDEPSTDEEPLEIYWDDVRVARHRRQPDPDPTHTVPRFSEMAAENDMVIGTSRNRVLVIIKPTGELVFGPEYNPSEAAMLFWEHMGQRRLMMEERLLLIQHMEAILVRLGRADMDCERLRRAAEDEQDPQRKAERTQQAEISLGHLNMIAHQAIELGRGLVRRPEIPVPAVPIRVPETIRQNPDTEYVGREGLPNDLNESE